MLPSRSDAILELLLNNEDFFPKSCPWSTSVSLSPTRTNVSSALTTQLPREKPTQMNHCCHVRPYRDVL